MKGFKDFIMRGNLVDLAVAVVIGTQFAILVRQFVASFIDPLLGLTGGKANFSTLTFRVGKAVFAYGVFLTDVLTFVLTAAVVYFLIVLPVSHLLKLFERNKAATQRDCPQCTLSIPVAAKRCPECTTQLVADSGQPQSAGAANSQPRSLMAPPAS